MHKAKTESPGNTDGGPRFGVETYSFYYNGEAKIPETEDNPLYEKRNCVGGACWCAREAQLYD